MVVHLGEFEGVCLLHVVWPVLGEAWRWEADGSVEGDAGVALLAEATKLADPYSALGVL